MSEQGGVPVPVNEPFAFKSVAIGIEQLDLAYSRAHLLDDSLEILVRSLTDDPQIYLDRDANGDDMVLVMILIQPLREPT